MLGRNKDTIYYCEKSNIIKAWQLVRKNFKKDIPDFIKSNGRIEVWYVDGRVSGQITYPPSTPPNVSNKQSVVNIPEGAWIILYPDGVYDIMSDEAFNMFFNKVIVKEN